MEDSAIIYIDESHAVHSDAKGHSEMFTTMGRGALLNIAKKLGLVTLSSTKTEIVSTGEQMPQCTWFCYFRMGQGDDPVEDIQMQDNVSAVSREPHQIMVTFISLYVIRSTTESIRK